MLPHRSWLTDCCLSFSQRSLHVCLSAVLSMNEGQAGTESRGEEGYLDYKIVCEEMDELMKLAAPEEPDPPGISVFEPNFACFSTRSDVTREAVTRFYTDKHSNSYFDDLAKRVVASTSGPREERIALFVVALKIEDRYFFHPSRGYYRNSVYYDAFHELMRKYLAEGTTGDFCIDNFRETLFAKWNERDGQKSESASKSSPICCIQ